MVGASAGLRSIPAFTGEPYRCAASAAAAAVHPRFHGGAELNALRQ